VCAGLNLPFSFPNICIYDRKCKPNLPELSQEQVSAGYVHVYYFLPVEVRGGNVCTHLNQEKEHQFASPSELARSISPLCTFFGIYGPIFGLYFCPALVLSFCVLYRRTRPLASSIATEHSEPKNYALFMHQAFLVRAALAPVLHLGLLLLRRWLLLLARAAVVAAKKGAVTPRKKKKKKMMMKMQPSSRKPSKKRRGRRKGSGTNRCLVASTDR